MKRFLFATNTTPDKAELMSIMTEIKMIQYWEERQNIDDIRGFFDIGLYLKVKDAKQQLNTNTQ